MSVETAVEYPYPVKCRKDGERSIRAAAVDNDNVLCPSQVGHRAGDVVLFIVR